MSRYLRAEIIENSPVNKSHNLLILSSSGISKNSAPGQFYMIETASSYDPLLKRPFSIFRNNPPSPPFSALRRIRRGESKGGMGGFSNRLHFLYRIKGKGTEKMRQMKNGASVSVLGPLGNGYPLPGKNLTPILIAGGIGIASLFPLAEKLGKNAYLFYGGRTKEELLMLDELKGMVKELIISTNDGSAGEKGTVVDVLKNFLAQRSALSAQHLLYACGPSPMLEAVSRLATEKGIKGYISMEENMACGVGACLGCTVKVRSQKSEVRSKRLTPEFTYKRVCKEGPVFPIEEIVW
ncbi:MAG: dihydroorotate dehydrogenase electron transfer subunit [Thermodesulfovibrionales bacterium]|nr:dihydroorotate dehydrogenase electron transfer subunit [Thermodesulfovibrionales bacterium]